MTLDGFVVICSQVRRMLARWEDHYANGGHEAARAAAESAGAVRNLARMGASMGVHRCKLPAPWLCGLESIARRAPFTPLNN